MTSEASPSVDWNLNPALFHALDDVHTRFLLNLPPSELASADRIFFQLEQAWWFYEDMLVDNNNNNNGNGNDESEETTQLLPRFSTLKPFAKLLFDFSPLFPNKEDAFQDMWHQFSLYKRKISTYGTILLNKSGTHIIMCQTWKGETWTFPAGKINQGESGIQAAARETYEETGFDPHCLFGLTKEWLETDPSKVTWKHPLPEGKSAFSYEEPSTGKRRTCYICHGVPDDFDFAPVARKEVSDIQWFPISLQKDDTTGFPKKTFAVLPFMGRLKSWIRRNVKDRPKSRPNSRPKSNGRDKSSGRSKSNIRKAGQQPRANSFDDPLVAAGLAQVGEEKRWTAEEMFKVNAALTGKEVQYDGNPHVFSEQGFQGVDPHAFRVVGGSFMNTSEGLSDKLVDERQQHYQPLVNVDGESALKPFFSDEGATPWGDVVEEAKQGDGTNPPPSSSSKKGKNKNKKKNSKQQQQQQPSQQDLGQSLLSKLQGTSSSSSGSTFINEQQYHQQGDPLDILTDAHITQRSQQEKLKHQKYLEDQAYINNWVSNLPQPKHQQYRIHVNIDDILAKFSTS
ncbi:unnamed protein product [Cylindrotheca closterium]|uniref:Nudix hydrolase domain-containing protein n=1 Tax=Cylindrotheca closterium TaxID=2856 RepID=A0AAD2G1F2_9STRA|nr:unnamed protein product [Cylindrotheca closterium]